VNDTTSDEQQPRIPGVRYKAETRFRQETTVIDGRSSTRDVPYTVYVAQPPRDWDRVIIRGVTGLAIGITGLAVIGTTASVGGQLSEILHPVISYGVGVVFTATWMACLGLEWVLSQTDPKRAVPARVGGWIALAISMAAVFTYGHDHGQDLAGGVGACLDLLAKGLWALLIYAQDVPLRAGIANWVQDQAEEAAGQAKLARRIAALNRIAEQHRAVGGREYQAAGAIMTSAETTTALPAPTPVMQAAAPAPGPVIPDPVPPVLPVPQPPVQPAGQTGHSAGQAPAQTPAQTLVPPLSGQPSAQATAPNPAAVPDPSGQDTDTSGKRPSPKLPANVTELFGDSRAATIRNALNADPDISDAALTDLVRQAHGDSTNLADNVRRARQREENPKHRARPRRKSS
jgi:hypothetical protein